jgi:hypothetical protein
MKYSRTRDRFVTVLVCSGLLSLAIPSSAQTSSPTRTYALRTNQAFPGSVDSSFVSRSPYPLSKRYEDFTPEQRKSLRSLYLEMPDSDDPPFPREGMRQIVADIATLIERKALQGTVSIAVAINSRGEATGVKLLEYPDIETAKAIAYILVVAKYRAGTCAGQPCAMEFPFRFDLQSR